MSAAVGQRSVASGSALGSFDDTQILLFALEDGRLRAVDQFVGVPTAVIVSRREDGVIAP